MVICIFTFCFLYRIFDFGDVFNFQNPRPLGFEFEAIAMVIIEWSVLNLGTISKVLILLIKLWLVRKKSSLH